MKIDVIVPVYNGERYVAQAIESVLNQRTQHTINVIVVDDGSTDNTAGVVADFGSNIRYLHKLHSGVGETRNAGVRESSSEAIAFLDADDLWELEKIEGQASRLLEDPDLEAVFGQSVQFLSRELDATEHRHRKIITTPHLLRLTSTILIRRVAFLRVGEFAPVSIGAEIDWMMRATQIGLRYRSVPEVVHRRRIHETNHTLTHRTDRAEYARILKRSLDRRREQNKIDQP